MATRFVVLSTQRSGTTMLVHDLRTHPDVTCHGEVFAKGCVDPNGYRAYRGTLPWRPAGGHLDRLYSEAGQAVGLKIMYNHLRLPYLKTALRRRHVNVVHVVRSNLLKQVVSHIVASERGIFASSEQVSPTWIVCPTEGLVKRLAAKQQRVEQHRRWCNRLKHLEIRYETLVDSPEESHYKLLDFLAVDPARKLHGGRVKLNPDRLESFVSNYAEVVDVLKDTEFAYMLD